MSGDDFTDEGPQVIWPDVEWPLVWGLDEDDLVTDPVLLRLLVKAGRRLTMRESGRADLAGMRSLQGADFRDSDLTDADLRRCRLGGARLSDAEWNGDTRWPSGVFGFVVPDGFEESVVLHEVADLLWCVRHYLEHGAGSVSHAVELLGRQMESPHDGGVQATSYTLSACESFWVDDYRHALDDLARRRRHLENCLAALNDPAPRSKAKRAELKQALADAGKACDESEARLERIRYPSADEQQADGAGPTP
jgi:hypothetical protein